MKFIITSEGSAKARADIEGVIKARDKLGATANLQKGFKEAAGQASNFVAILTGDKLTGATSQITAFSGAIGGIPGPAGLAIGGIVGLTGVAVAGGAALFGLAKSASDFGSTIHDASIKTGLGAETISALKLAADQSGSSLEQMTNGIAKFAKNVGAAGDDAKKSAEFVKNFGITPQAALNDLDGSLAKVFKRIGDAKPGVEQITLAQKAFGKSGADLIPLMEQVGFNLDDFRKRAKELGITIGDDTARKADEFGDQMTELEAQLAGVGRTIGFAVMPEFLEMSQAFGAFVSRNRDEWQTWGSTIANVLHTTVDGLTKLVQFVNDHSTSFRVLLAVSTMGQSEVALQTLRNFDALGAANRPTVLDSPHDLKQTGYYSPRGTYAGGGAGAGGSGAIHKAPKETDSEFRRFFTEHGFSVNRTFGGAINSGSPHPYGGAADVSIAGKTAESIFALLHDAIMKGYRVVDERAPVPGIRQTRPHLHFENAKTTLSKASIFQAIGGISPDQVEFLRGLDQERLGKASGMADFDRFLKERNDKKKKADDDEFKIGMASAEREYDLARAKNESLLQFDEMYYAKSRELGDSDTALATAQTIHDRKIALAEAEVAEAERVAKAQVAGSEAAEDANQKWALARIKADGDIAAANEDLYRRTKQVEDDELKRLDDILDRMHKWATSMSDVKKHLHEIVEELKAIDQKDKDDRDKTARSHSIWDLGKVQDAHDTYKKLTDDMKRITDETFGSMVDAVGSAIQGWALYGDSIGESMKKATAAILANIAAQAAIEAIWETAKGVAMLALGLFGHPGAFASAAAHFQAAAIYGTLAAGAAFGARGLSGGKGGAGAGAGGGANGQRQIDQNPQPYTRMSENSYNSGHRGGEYAIFREIRDHLRHNNEIMGQFRKTRAGEVLMSGMREKPGAIGNQAVADVKRNSGIGRQLASSVGIK